MEMITAPQVFDARNLVSFNNFGCGTSIQTVEKEMGTRVDTNEVGS
jgi:hypothetical protein